MNHGGVFGTNFVAEKVSEYYQGEVRSIADNKIELVTEERLYYSLIGETYFDLWFEPSYGMVQRAFPDISPSQYETFTSQYETVYLVLVFYPVPC
ncbi:MAG: hypothetical protein DPW16_08280 [Chloroflexi bacterium]|nr:hypothetical protein [Chloroflexota bacterium]